MLLLLVHGYFQLGEKCFNIFIIIAKHACRLPSIGVKRDDCWRATDPECFILLFEDAESKASTLREIIASIEAKNPPGP